MGSDRTRPAKHKVPVAVREPEASRMEVAIGRDQPVQVDGCGSRSVTLTRIDTSLVDVISPGTLLGLDVSDGSVIVTHEGQELGSMSTEDSLQLNGCLLAGNSYIAMWEGKGMVYVQKV